jgi:putative Flp pilus-assembly TadE/G-like protein
MMTASIVAMMGLMALTVDLGLSYFLKKTAQTAADAAALAGASAAMSNLGANTVPSCATNVTCQAITACPSPVPNPPTNNLHSACLYAQQHGFTQGGNGGVQNVTVAADVTPTPPTVPGVNVIYWVTVRVAQSVPGMFGSVLGFTNSTVAARATASISQGTRGGTLYVLNRQNDTSGIGSPGTTLANGGTANVTVPGGIMMASIANGSNNPSYAYAGNLQGSADVEAPFTNIRGAGTVTLGGSAVWHVAPRSGFSDGPMFYDPMGGMGQPSPLPSAGQTNYVGVANGCLDCLTQPLQPGQYYAIDSRGRPTGDLLKANADVTFSDGGSGFGNYVFYGGLAFPATHTNIVFYPGRYVLAGALSSNDIISFHTQVYIRDQGTAGQQNTDAGEIFIFTDPTYPGLAGHYPPALAGTAVLSSLQLRDINLQAGNNPDIGINLHGLNVANSNVPTDLKSFAPSVFWQDQRNSRVTYDSNGNIDTTSCGGGHSIDNPCTNTSMASSSAPGATLQAHPGVQLYGLIYQPRGAWMTLQGGGSISSPLMFVTGALSLQGSASLTALQDRDQLHVRQDSLIE